MGGITGDSEPDELWPPNGKTTAIIVSGAVSDVGSKVDVSSGGDSEGRTYTIAISAKDRAGNVGALTVP